jgi:hypothetical protein
MKRVSVEQEQQQQPVIIDLVDEMEWEDSDKIEKVTLEEAGLEERAQHSDECFKEGILDYMQWFYDGELPGYSD